MAESGLTVTVREDLAAWWVNRSGRLAGFEDIREWRSDGEMLVELAAMGYEPDKAAARRFWRVGRSFGLKEIA